MSAPDERKKMEENLQNYKANIEHFEMSSKAIAEMLMVRYKHLIGVGFTERQAFTIIVKRGLG